MIFMGRSGPPAPSVSAHIRVSNSLNSHFIYFFAGPGQFTKRLLIISADATGKDSMIYLRSKRPRTSNSGHLLFKSLGSHMMMALTQENVHHTLNSGPGLMNKSNRVHARIQEFLSGGRGGGSRPDGQKTVWTMFFQSSTYFTVYRGDPMVFLQRGGGVQTNLYNL